MEWRFLHPEFLLLLPLPLVWLIWHFRRARRTPAVTYSDVSVLAAAGKSWRLRALTLLPWLRTLVLILGVIALARPQYGQTERLRTALGIDIALVLDVSGSMDLDDFRPTRLEVAKQTAIDFVNARVNDRFTTIIFGTEAHILVPPTLDREAVMDFLALVDENILPREARRTAIGDGLALAVRKLDEIGAETPIIVLLTDGENNAGRLEPMQAAEIARTMGMRVYTIAVGTNETIVRTVRDEFGRTRRQVIEMSIDEDLLEEIAEMTGGKFFSALDEAALADVYRQIDELERSEIETNEFDDYDERFLWLWGPALLLLALELFARGLWLGRLP